MTLINFFNDIASDINLSPNHSLNLRMRVTASLDPYVYPRLVLSLFNWNAYKISVWDRPLAFVPHVVYFERFWFLVEDFYLEELRVYLC